MQQELEGLIDVPALARWMDEARLPGAGEELQVRPIGGGASNEIFSLRRGAHALVLRRPPREVPAGRNQTMLREYRVLRALRGTRVPHARVHAVCEDESIVGACFYVMDHVEGWSPMQMNGVWPAPFDEDLAARQGLAFELVEAIARLGRVDWRAAGLEGFGKPEGFLDRQVDRWLHHLSTFQFREIPKLEVAADWLRLHTPASFQPGIIHGDYQFANVMFHEGAPAKMAAIVDWEMATVGDPLLDLGWVLMGWPNPDEDRGAMAYVDYAGMPSREQLMERYASISGLPMDEIDYYVVLARFKMACVLEGGYARYVKGGADNEKIASFGPIVLDMAVRAAELAQRSKL
jgi:aminoglycoside phosphotransferase (APT) family kinase protein